MLRRLLAFAVLPVVMPIVCSASSYVIPTTTLAALTSNNTSAGNSFGSQSNGNRGAGNVSKVDVHSLLYSGSITKVYAHLMLWFGPGSGHMNVGYSSTDPGQVNNQINDMVSRGIDGVIIDWYGPNNSIDQATQLVMAAAQNHPGFTFAIMIDAGAMAGNSCWGCSPQQVLINLLQYVEHNYFSSPAYMTRQGRPVVTNFNIDYNYDIDWNAVSNSLNTQPMFLFQDNVGFSQALSGGSFAWVRPTAGDYGMGYLSNFYQTGMSFPHEQTVGASYKGFNDSLAPWSSGRVMSQQCGQTWLQTFSEVNSLYNSGTQLADLQLVTWNDYEEATEIESGIDNCLSVAASVSGNNLQWTVTGDDNTIDHYTLYVSTDGQNLMPLGNLAPQVSALNLCSFPVPAGSYKLFVQAVGKPSIANQITRAIPYNSTCAPAAGTSGGSNISFRASPSSIVISPGKSGTFTVTAQTQSGSMNNPIALSCSGVPSNLNCSFSPVSITPGSGVGTSVVTVLAAGEAASAQGRNFVPIYAGWLLPLGMIALPFVGKTRLKGKAKLHTVLLLVGLGMITVSCGGGSSGNQTSAQAGPGNYSVTINGNSSSSQLSTVVTITVQ